jgi:hypothetical protein
MRWITFKCLVSALLFVLTPPASFSADLITGDLYSDGITGRPGVRTKGWFEQMAYTNHKSGTGAGALDYAGGWHSWQRGLFEIRLPDSQVFPAGQYGFFTLGYNEVPGFDYVTDVSVPGGSGTHSQDIYVRADYSVQFDNGYDEWPGNIFDERWVWGDDFYQTFTATSRHITRLATRLVARNDSVHNIGFQLLQVNAGPPSSWTPVLPVRERYIGGHGNDVLGQFIWFVPYHSSEVTITPGQTYALRIFCTNGTGETYNFGIFARPDSGDGYAQGHLWVNDSPLTGWDAYGYVTGGGDNNTVINYAPIEDYQTAVFIGFGNQLGQTFRATGEGLAAVEMTVAPGEAIPQLPLSFQLYDSPGGTPIGPPKNSHTGQVHAYLWRAGAFWHPGEAPLTPGQTYYIELSVPHGLNTWNMNEGYPYGDAYVDRVLQADRDILMSIAEYEDLSGGPTPTPPPGGGNLLSNWSFEASGGTSHPGWINNSGFRTGEDFPTPGTAYDGAIWVGYSYGMGGTEVQDLYQTVSVTPGHTYDAAAWTYLGGSYGTTTATLLWHDGAYPGKTGGTPLENLVWNGGDPLTGWTELSGNLTPTSSTITFILRLEISGMGGGNFDACSLIDTVEPPTPTPTVPVPPTVTPTPPPGGNLIINGNMESGTPGTTDHVPDNWTRWLASGQPTYWYGPDYGRNGTAGGRLIGGSINGKVFDAGLYQRVTGIIPGHEYELTGWSLVVPQNAGDFHAWIGLDLTGQTSNGVAGTVTYWENGGDAAWEQLPPKRVVATGNSITVFLRAAIDFASATFYTDFDDLSLVDLGPAIVDTPTPVPTATATPTPTFSTGVSGFRVY